MDNKIFKNLAIIGLVIGIIYLYFELLPYITIFVSCLLWGLLLYFLIEIFNQRKTVTDCLNQCKEWGGNVKTFFFGK